MELAWITAYETEVPLHALFPIRLTNGKRVQGIHLICSRCGNAISGNHLRGRVAEPLPHVVMVTANGMCARCNHLTHVDCRFRATANKTVVEWRGPSGNWYSRKMRPQPLLEEIVGRVRRWAAWFRPTQ